MLVRLTDEDGRIGWGETTTFLEVYGYDQRSLYHTLTDYLIPNVIGLDAGDLEAIHDRMDRVVPSNLMAKAGLDIAAHDLASRAAGVPLHARLGARRTDRVPLIGVVDIVGPEAAAQSARPTSSPWAFRPSKSRSASIPPPTSGGLKPCGRPSEAPFACESTGTAAMTGTRPWPFPMEDCSLEWIEQPLPAWDLEGMAALARQLKTPVAVDESVYTVHDAGAASPWGQRTSSTSR